MKPLQHSYHFFREDGLSLLVEGLLVQRIEVLQQRCSYGYRGERQPLSLGDTWRSAVEMVAVTRKDLQLP